MTEISTPYDGVLGQGIQQRVQTSVFGKNTAGTKTGNIQQKMPGIPAGRIMKLDAVP